MKGSATVLINGLPAARLGDQTTHGGVIVAGCPHVLIGERGGGASLGPMGAADEAGRPCLEGAAKAGSPFVRP